jgi:hypothetical protein
MSQSQQSLEAALRAVAAGDWDALTSEQVERLERVLNDEPGMGARLADRRPELGPRLAEVLDVLARRERPVPQRWEEVWQQIDRAAPAARRGAAARPVTRIMRFWPGLVAAAACALLAFLWTVQPAESEEWPMRLATSVEIDDLEVPEGMTSFVISTGGENGVQIIWVLEDRG